MEASAPSKGIFDSANLEAREHVVELLRKAYWMEIETVMSYLSASVNLDGVRAQEVKESLGEDIEEELGHARRFAEQSYLQPPEEQTDIVHVIRGVIKAETGAIEHYTRIVEETDGVDPVTQDMVIDILHDEQGHRRLFEGFLREYEIEGIA
jgi:bacterioferritin